MNREFLLKQMVQFIPYGGEQIERVNTDNQIIVNPYWTALIELTKHIKEKNTIPTELLQKIPWRKELEAGVNSINYWASMSSALFELRETFVKLYSWAITSPRTVEFIAGVSGDKIIELGAGNGYWASILKQYGKDVIAYDIDPPTPTYHEVIQGDHRVLSNHQDRTLLLVWPPYNTAMGADCLQHYKGDTIIYIGEFGGCTADEKFHNILDNEWKEANIFPIASWPYIHDRVYIYKR